MRVEYPFLQIFRFSEAGWHKLQRNVLVLIVCIVPMPVAEIESRWEQIYCEVS